MMSASVPCFAGLCLRYIFAEDVRLIIGSLHNKQILQPLQVIDHLPLAAALFDLPLPLGHPSHVLFGIHVVGPFLVVGYRRPGVALRKILIFDLVTSLGQIN